MAIGELLLAKDIINEEQLKKVLHQQKIAGGRLGDNLVALGYHQPRRSRSHSSRASPGAKNIDGHRT